MKKTILTAITTAIVTAIAIACFAGCSKQSVKQTATAYLDQEGNTVTATVDLSDGYSCEFTRGAIYLCDRNDADAVAIAMTLEKDTYDDYAAAAGSASDRKDINGGVMYSADGQYIYICKVGDSAYFGIFADKATSAQMEKYIARFDVVPES
jgi:hypothetical protein